MRIAIFKIILALFLCFLTYLLVGLLIFSVALIGIKTERVYEIKILNDVQRAIYYEGIRNIWQYDENCISFDEYLFYKPKIGQCNFKNIEFNTLMTFGKNGRLNSNANIGDNDGLAVLGDSYAMGWGVEDNETFSALLEKDLNRKVYNLGVSSYGTYRELQALERSGLLNKVNNIVIQYCDNDIFENKARVESDPRIPSATKEYFDNLVTLQQMTHIDLYKKWILISFCSPSYNYFSFCNPSKNELEIDFKPHVEPLLKVLDKFPWIKNKKVLIFYTNRFGIKFDNFENLKLAGYENITFIDLDTPREGFFLLDDHMNRDGHKYVAKKLKVIYSTGYLNKLY